MNETTRAQLVRLQESLHGWALGDVKKAAASGAKVGAFILAANLIDVLARLGYSGKSENASAGWDEFVPEYLPRYIGHSNALYRNFRSAISHNYSLKDIRLTDGSAEAHRHWTVEQGEHVLHLESFIADLEAASEKFHEALRHHDVLRDRVIRRASARPPLGIVGGTPEIPSASVAQSMSVATFAGLGATHWGPLDVSAASGASWLSHNPSYKFDPLAKLPPKTAMPKRKRKRKRKPKSSK